MKQPFKQIILACTVMAIATVRIAAAPHFGNCQLFVNDWQFALAGNVQLTPVNVEQTLKWKTVTLPHDWSVEGPYSSNLYSATGYLPGGFGWYKKTFDVPADKKGQKVYVYFEGIYNRSHVYLNGHLVGGRPNGYISFDCDLTPYLQYGKKNTLLVSVDHTRVNDSRWYTGSGIYRDVWLVYASPVHKQVWGTYCRSIHVTSEKADFMAKTTLLNESARQVQTKVCYDLSSKQTGANVASAEQTVTLSPGDSIDVQQPFTVDHPELWNIGTPNLYRLKTTVYVNGELTETDEQFVGARELTFSHDEGLAINGHPVKLKGVCIHHDAGCLGSAVPRQVWYRRIKHLKEMGCNAIRTSHNPQASDLYDICDELGLVVIDEAFDEWEYPKKKWVKGWNVGTPTYDGNYDYFKEWGETDLKDMILRDRNHPSVIMWSIGNEVDYPNDPYSHPILDSIRISQPVYGGWLPGNPQAEQLSSLSRKLVDVVHRYDPTRPATAGLAGVAMSNHTDYPFNLDVCGYNYTESLYEKDHATYPERILYGSENSQDPQAWNVVRDSKYVFGQFIWTGIDYLGESGQWPSRGFYTGMLDFGGFLKTNGLYRQAMWSEKPVVNLTTAPLTGAHRRGAPLPGWNYKEGARIVVTCMGNTPYARLTLNGVEVGQPKAIDKDRYSTSWSIPYQKGTLTVEGLNEAKEVCCSSAVTTAGVPVRLTALPDVRVIEKERGVSQIELDVTDSQGVLVPSAKNEITCRIAGPVRLLGLENSNNADMSDYRDNRQCVYHGRLIAYIQATGQKGKATITFSSPSLKSTSIELDIN